MIDYMRSIIRTVLSFFLPFCVLGVTAETISPYAVPPGALLSAHWVYAGAFNRYWHKSIHEPSPVVRQLSSATPKLLSPSLLKQADAVANSQYRVILTLVEKGEAVFSYRRSEIQDDSFVISYSMAKSLTSLMVGHAMCAGHIKSLDDKLGDYVPELVDTAYGRSSIRHILNMASGANASGKHGEPTPGVDAEIRNQEIGYLEILLKHKEAKPRLFGRLAPGDAFDYKNLDTAALSLLLEKATQRPFHRLYEETLISAAGLAHKTAWNLDKDKRAIAHAFFYASPDDWIRLALYTLDAYKGRVGPCMQGYMRQVITNGVRVYNYSEHSSYGYQFWTGMPGVNSDIFWMRGHGGQMIAIDPNKERILVTASTHEDPTVLSLFRNWVNSD
jgi:CubicO group peptidase (beta-lactamase class C family)